MNKLVIRKTAMFLQEKNRRRYLRKIVLCLSLIIAFVTCYLLILPAITMEKNVVCGMEEHSHTQECYQSRLICGQEERQAVPGKEETVLICEKAKHEHTQECQDENGQIICGYDAHVHGTECYLTTSTQGVEGHTHTEACYTQELVCQKPEHIHTDVCYPQQSDASGAGTNGDQSNTSDSGMDGEQPDASGAGTNGDQSNTSDSGMNGDQSNASDSGMNGDQPDASGAGTNENQSDSMADSLDETEWESDCTFETETEMETKEAAKEDQLVLEITNTSVNEETGLVQVEVSYRLGQDCQNSVETRLYVENQNNMNFPQFENYRFTNADDRLFKLVHKTDEQYYIRYQLQPGEAFRQTFEIGVSGLEAGANADFVVYASAVGDALPENSSIDQEKYNLTYTETGAELTSILDLKPGESITFHASFGGARTSYEVTIRKGTQHSYGKLSDTTENPYSTFEYIVSVPDLGIVDQVAFCVQPQKPGPGDGTYILNPVGSDLLAKICYYTKVSNWNKSEFFSLESSQYGMTYSLDEIFVLGHITAAKVWGDSAWSYRTNASAQAAAQRLIDFCQNMPDMSFSKSSLEIDDYYKTETGEWRQKTEQVTFNADNIVTNGQSYKQTYKMTLPEGIQLHIIGADNEETVQTGEVEIVGGTTFYLSAPLDLTEENRKYISPSVTVTHLNGLQSYEIVTTAATQTLALVFGDAEKQEYSINFEVEWNTDISAAVQFNGTKELTGRALQQGENSSLPCMR